MRALLAALLLLLCACCLQAALVRREAPAEDAAPATLDGFFTRQFQTLSEFMTKELPQKLQAEELRSQAEAYLDRANKQLAPLAQELRSNFVGLFTSLLDLGKDKGEGKP
ncbi:apolipoprotein A-II [Patagioenas fasciata]